MMPYSHVTDVVVVVVVIDIVGVLVVVVVDVMLARVGDGLASIIDFIVSILAGMHLFIHCW
jgi:hypothetical protein